MFVIPTYLPLSLLFENIFRQTNEEHFYQAYKELSV
jgi:hypothetical protein